MLLITHAGLTVNTAHVAYIACRQEVTEPPETTRPASQEIPIRVLLILPGGDSIVAARSLSPAAARFLREAITRTWAEGNTLTDVRELLQRHNEGAYIAASAAEAVPAS